ncbi:alpha/beta hydrolase family protein [Amycolatopsis albispora]|uniref:Acetylhydrolase n=1 Tax=Amycolatopsis albispora TaxID=1804986 RepID=A0A344KZJ7_9PSEU|nr:prolyl oligopeptidase family serine peptidase [Amycolatopsis albispora]AXB41221.1 acetylhydrolase [Amycolatopsis albispora]
MIRKLLATSLAALMFAGAFAATGTASAAGELVLPAPTGPAAVGRSTLHLTDHSRRDPWVPERPRELMVSLYYPAQPGTGSPARYLSTEEARLLLEMQHREDLVSPRKLSETRTNARDHARPVPGRHPLLVLSPGFTLPRATLTVLTEDLASRGYLVALVDHAYESSGAAFPGGRMLTCVACAEVERTGDAGYRRVAQTRARDVSFVLDRLGTFGRLVDRGRIGIAGHSIGGNTAAVAMAGDPRFRAGVNLDGEYFEPVTGLSGRPFLMMGTETLHRPDGGDRTWPRDWPRFDGWKRWLTVAGSGHFSFIDLPVLAAQLGVTDPAAPLPGTRSGEITRAYTGAFFDQHLRSLPRPLLDGPSAEQPEVGFHSPQPTG